MQSTNSVKAESRKKIAVVQFYFYPDISAVSQLMGDLLAEIAGDGRYDITVFCGRSSYVKESEATFGKERHRSVRIKRIITTNFGKRNFITRLLDFCIYYVAIFFYSLFSRN